MKKSKVVLVGGLPGTGKTYFASRFAKAMGARYLSTDRTRKEMFSKRSYTEAEKEQVYEEILGRMRAALERKEAIVIDGTFYRQELRDRFLASAEGYGVDPILIVTTASDSTLKQRLGQPREDSEADYAVYQKLKPLYEPPQRPFLLLHTDRQTVEESIALAIEYIKEHTTAHE